MIFRSAPPKPRPIPAEPERRINTTDPDSRPVKTATGFIQGYTAQAAATEAQVIVAAEVITGGNERARLRPMADAAEQELTEAGITELPGTALADAGYWNSPQIEELEAKGIRVLVPPDANTRRAPTKIRSGPRYERMRERLKEPDNEAAYRRRQQMIEPVFAQIKVGLRAGRFQTPRLGGLPLRMATDRRHSQPPEAPPQRFGAGWGLIGGFGPPIPVGATITLPSLPFFSRLCATASMRSRRSPRRSTRLRGRG